MSWHFLQEQEAACWDQSSLAGAPSALSRLIPNAALHSLPGNAMESSNDSQYGMTCARSMADHGAAACSLSLEDSPARTSAAPAPARGSTESDPVSGWRWNASFAKWSPIRYGWKTRQLSLLEDSPEFSGIWPRWGSMQGGECFPLAMLAHDTSVQGSFVLPTVLASWDRRGPGLSNNLDNLRASLSVTERTLRIVNHYGWRWPTPVLEWMMMWPEGWSALTPLATDRFQQWLLEHGGCSTVRTAYEPQ
jgi:hypothetical protein